MITIDHEGRAEVNPEKAVEWLLTPAQQGALDTWPVAAAREAADRALAFRQKRLANMSTADLHPAGLELVTAAWCGGNAGVGVPVHRGVPL
jgi:hypothetical protein